jgi:hypothetical protein
MFGGIGVVALVPVIVGPRHRRSGGVRVQLMEGCLRGLPEFVCKKTGRNEPLPIAVPNAGGELPLVCLGWPPDIRGLVCT